MNRSPRTLPSAPVPRAAAVPHHSLPPRTFAFQPIVDAEHRTVVSYEALVRGPQGESAASIINEVAPSDLARFDEYCRAAAMHLAARLQIPCNLNLNLLPQGFQADRDCLASALDAAIELRLAPECLVLEVTEGEVLGNQQRFTDLMDVYRGLGMRLALDDFGSGYSGLNLLADFQPDQLKLDKNLCRGISTRGPRQAIVRAVIQVCRDLDIQMIAECIETADELRWFRDEGVSLFQGYLFGQPALERLPAADFSALD